MRNDLEPIPSTLKPVVRALQAGKPEVAARCLVGVVLDRRVPVGRALAPWLARKIGPPPMRELIAAFAEYPCFVCRGGYEVCQHCRGRGRTRDSLCEPCLGFGVCNCKFCGGSGWVTINFVPQGLRFLTVLQRIRKACDLMCRIVAAQRKVDRTSRNGDAVVLKEQVALILRWNRVLTIFENAVLALRLCCTREPMDARLRDRWIARCVRYGGRADRHIRQILGQLARRDQSRPKDAEFYAEVRQNPSFSDELEHPFLRRAMAETARKRVKSGFKSTRVLTKGRPYNSMAVPKGLEFVV